jgi:Mannosyltransferase putative
VSDDALYAAYHRLQDGAIRDASPYPADRFSGRGIVTTAGGPRHFTSAWVTLNVLRRVLGCTLPVQLWYLGPREMSGQMLELLHPLEVECVDALEVRQRHPMRRLGAWECKPFAIVHSPFREVLWLDADNSPLVDPSFLFSEPEYARSGAIFWPDLTSLPPDHPIWAICRVPWRDEPAFESGQIVLDKARCWTALQLTVHLNARSDFYYQYVYGDKETFHLAWRMLDQPYSMPSRLPRKAIGYWSRAPATDGGCWTLFQHDLAGRPIFHHRTSTGKWNLLGENLSFDGFPFEAFCRAALDDLRQQWDGRVGPPPRPSRAARTEREIVAASPFCYVRRAADERTLQLLPKGRIGEGAAAAERSWRLEQAGGEPVLVISGEYGVICRLRLDADGVWRGRWLQFEQMPVELIPLG